VVLYPQYSQIDVIQGTDPSTMLVMLLAEMFPEPENGQVKLILTIYVISLFSDVDDCLWSLLLTAQACRNVQWDTRGEYHVSNLVPHFCHHAYI
jgi:hypothetical protein